MGFGFKVNYNNAAQNDLIPAGEYEVYIKSAGFNATQNGSEYISVQMVVRDDIDQPQKNRMISDALWLSEKAMEFTERKMNAISKLCALDDSKEYNAENYILAYNAWGTDITGKFIKVKVTHQPPRNGYDERAVINRYMETEYPQPMKEISGLKDAAIAAKGFTKVNNEELPF